MLIDFHVHIYPKELAKRVLAPLHARNARVYSKADPEDTAERLKQWGVDKAVALNIATTPKSQSKVNDFAISQNGGMFICFGSVHPDAPDISEELLRLKDSGIKGIKIHPYYQGCDVDEPRMLRVFDLCAELGFPVLIHTGLSIDHPEKRMGMPHSLRKAHRKIPRLQMIAAHMGGSGVWDEVEEYLVGEDIVFDTSYLDGRGAKKEQMERMIGKHGAENIVFGSDCPWSSGKVLFDFVDSFNLTDDQKELIFHKNAERILEIPSAD